MDNKKHIYSAIFTVNGLIAISYLIWRVLYTIPTNQGIADLIVSVIFLAVEAFGMIALVMQLIVIRRSGSVKEEPVKPYETAEYPEIDIYVFNREGNQKEAYNTINACLLLDYPDRNKVHIISVEGDVAQLNDAFFKSGSPLVAVIEAGMLPRHEFLMEAVSIFLNNREKEKIGFVQTGFGFFNVDSYQFRLFSQRLVPNEKRYFLKCQQPVFDKDNSVVCCGSGVVFSREALNEIGGFDTQGPKGYLTTGIRLLKRGYRCRYVNQNLISGFFDSDIATCILKRTIRVADAMDAFKREHVIFSKELKFKQKRNLAAYLSSLASPFCSIVRMLIPVLYGILGMTVIQADALVLGVFWLLLYKGFDLSLRGFSGKCTSLKWRRIYEYSMAPFLVLPCIRALTGRYKPGTIEEVKANKLKNIRYFVPHLILGILNVIAFLLCVNTLIINRDPLSLLFAIWLFFNIYYELMSIFWLMGRPYARQEDRIEAHMSYELSDKLQTIHGMTRDLSLRGVSIWCDKPYDIDDTEVISIKLSNDRYQAELEGNVIGVERDARRWKYVIMFQDIETSKQQYYGILYDRKPSETSTIAAPQNIFSDIKRNIGRRFKLKTLEYRKMARIPVNQDIEVVGGESVFVKNYNYKYLIVRMDSQPDEYLTLIPVKGIELCCERIHKFGEHIYQYKVLNYEELRSNSEVREKLYEWVEQCTIENEIGLVADLNNDDE